MGVFFVAGVHGVGKTTTCQQAAQALGVPFFTASGLIKEEKATAIAERGKAVADIGGNQELLIRGIKRVLAESTGKVILDGHFTLFTSSGRIEPVAADVFRAMHVDRVVIFHDEPAAISARVKDRDGEIRTPDEIAHHQKAELAHGNLVCAELGLPILLLKAFDNYGLGQALELWR